MQPFEPKSFTTPSELAFADIAAVRTRGSIDTKLAVHGSSEFGTVIANFTEYSQVLATFELLTLCSPLLLAITAMEPYR